MEEHRFSRLELLVGSTGLQRLAQASVAVFGVGGVGSYAVEALARSGVGRLTLVDFDVINPSNINRQIHALEGTLGQAKVTVMARRCEAINPAMQVEPLKVFYDSTTAEELLSRGYDYVLDCIDTITSKLHLLQSCRQRELPVISAMGAGNKLDPSKISVGDLFHTQKCRLARVIRKELRRRGITSGIKVVYSTEEYEPPPGQLPAIGGRGDGRGTPDFTKLLLGSSSYLPPIFGMTMAGEVIRALLSAEP
ncbi:MAG: tRNA threonylcarbamoyladenosine dehydratase [Desulfuromonadales bacterium]|nr:tRNA threonylcarbamoyladenosine dehydratase [Desulfuromonadales bacterium]MDW7758469.1 tRNA threonylcarbamoyladenosine dehydratase [Desulfuromonadales bacterium]